MRSFTHIAATTAQEAIAQLSAAPDGSSSAPHLIAGGTDLLTLMKAGLLAPSQLIDLKPARELHAIRFEPDGSCVLGSLTTLADIERSPELAQRLPLLPQAVREAATPQLRAMATVAGNLMQRPRCWYYRGDFDCWLKGGSECFARDGQNKYNAIFGSSPCVATHPSDLAPALIALDAYLVVMGIAGVRTLPVAELFAEPTADIRAETRLQPGEIITALTIPPQPDGAQGSYHKAMDRHGWAFALVSVAAQLTLRDGLVERARIVLGGVAPIPWRVRAAEDALEGRAFSADAAAQAAELVVGSAHPLTHNRYKVPLARELARRALHDAAGMDW